MYTVSSFKVPCFSKDEMRTSWDSKVVSYPNFIRVDVFRDGDFEDSSSNVECSLIMKRWFASSFAALKFILDFIVNKCI